MCNVLVMRIVDGCMKPKWLKYVYACTYEDIK
jgi:hypothetical protein